MLNLFMILSLPASTLLQLHLFCHGHLYLSVQISFCIIPMSCLYAYLLPCVMYVLCFSVSLFCLCPAVHRMCHVTIQWHVPRGTSRQRVRAFLFEPTYTSTCIIMSTDGQGNWTDRGCNLTAVSRKNRTVTCSCNHLTNFALLAVRNAKVLYVVH